MLLAWTFLGSAAKYVAVVLGICMGSFVFTLKLTQWIFGKDDANPAMRVVSEAIREGSEGFLRVQYGAIATIALVIAVIIGTIYLFRESPSEEMAPRTLAIVTGVSYLCGAFASALAGYIGVWVSIRVNIRVAVAASKYSYKDALLLSFRGGAVSACLSASLCILGVTMLYVFCYVFFVSWGNLPARNVPMLLVGYGFGGALVALFMQLGGGIFTKAAVRTPLHCAVSEIRHTSSIWPAPSHRLRAGCSLMLSVILLLLRVSVITARAVVCNLFVICLGCRCGHVRQDRSEYS
jgi:inorganic pyrophosphatase